MDVCKSKSEIKSCTSSCHRITCLSSAVGLPSMASPKDAMQGGGSAWKEGRKGHLPAGVLGGQGLQGPPLERETEAGSRRESAQNESKTRALLDIFPSMRLTQPGLFVLRGEGGGRGLGWARRCGGLAAALTGRRQPHHPLRLHHSLLPSLPPQAISFSLPYSSSKSRGRRESRSPWRSSMKEQGQPHFSLPHSFSFLLSSR